MKKFYKLDAIANFDNINNFFAASGTPTYKTGAQELTLWNEAQFESVFEEQCEKSFYYKETSYPWGAFKNKYTQWLARNGNFIANELGVLLEKYNPIYNYDRHEVYGGSDSVTKTPEDWAVTKTQTPNNWKETTTQTPTGWIEKTTQTPKNWKETETQTPTQWQEQNVKSFSDYHETEKQTPTNWEKTETQTPTQWQKTSTDSFTNYHETETQTPTDWAKETTTEGDSAANGEATRNKIIPFNGTDFANTSATEVQRSQDVKEVQSGTYVTDREFSGTKSNTETQSGTYQTTTEQSGTYETDHIKTGTETNTKTQSGTYQTETAHTGTYESETEQLGTYQTETAHTGTMTETTEQTGTMEDVTEYGKTVDISGNIGVMSTEDMIKQVIELYDKDFVQRWITRFIDTYCVYV